MRSTISLLLVITFASWTLQDNILSCGDKKFALTPSSAITNPDKQQFKLRQINDVIPNVCSLTSNDSTAQVLTTSHSTVIGGENAGGSSTGYANPAAASHRSNERNILVFCDACKTCPENMPYIVDYLTKYSNERYIIVIVVPQDLKLQSERLSNSYAKVGFSVPVASGEKSTYDVCSDEGESSETLRSFSKTSVLFVSISFIILMVISLAWLVFYYVQRFRYAHAKDRMQRRLFNAAKKALTRIPTKPVKAGDKELDNDCPVCIDPYKAGDIVRMLPCRHIFHKTCVDPWLLEHRTCPMCKSDILKAFGYQVNVNNSRRRAQFNGQIEDHHSGIHVESDRLSTNSTTSDSPAFQFPVVSEIHDPFSFTPSTSPQLVQVMNEMNARAFSIIPLTVHSTTTPPQTNPAANTSSANRNVVETNATNNRGHPTNTDPRVLRPMPVPTASGPNKIRGHIVNLVHVRSRSLSQSQIPMPVPFGGEKMGCRADRRPSALIRTHGKPSGFITIEVPSSTTEEQPNLMMTDSSIDPPAPEVMPPTDPTVRMAVSHENVATIPGSVVHFPINRGHSVKTMGTEQKRYCRRVVGQPATFQVLSGETATRPATAVVADASAAQHLTNAISIESL